MTSATSDKTEFEKALHDVVHCKDESKLYTSLTIVRKNVNWPEHKHNIRKVLSSKCLRQMLSSIEYTTNKPYVSVVLSILGNCCMYEPFTQEFIQYEGFRILEDLLESYYSDDGVQGRSYRIIGNVFQHIPVDKKCGLTPSILKYMMKFLQNYAMSDNDRYTEATIVMALRVFRHLINYQKYFWMIEKEGCLKIIGAVLIKSCDRWMADGSSKHIVENVIKYLSKYSKYKYYPGISDMRNTPKGDALVHLAHILPLSPRKIVKIIMNFNKISKLKSEIPVREICEGLVSLLRNKPITKDITEEYREYIRCLCALLDHPANRNVERCKESVPLLVTLLDEFEDQTPDILETCLLIVIALGKCSFHPTMIQVQVDCKLIIVLTKKINWLLGNQKGLSFKHRFQRKRKRKSSIDFSSSWKIKLNSVELKEPRSPTSSDEESDFTLHVEARSCSPLSSSDSESLCSPWLSPKSTTNQQDYNSEDYSPVCSDTEDAKKVTQDCEKLETESDLKYSDGEDEDPHIKISTGFPLKYSLLQEMLSLLKTLSFHNPKPSELCSEDLVLTLLRCSNYFGPNSTPWDLSWSLIDRILDHDNLLPLLQTELIPSIYSLTRSVHGSSCYKCKQVEKIGRDVLDKFQCLAQSGRGRGDIANRLYRGNEDVQKKIISAVPYILKCNQVLSFLLLNCRGLEKLTNLLFEPNLGQQTMRAISMLAINLNVTTITPTPSRKKSEKIKFGNYELEDCQNIVSFVLDDGSVVKADRDFLKKQSDFFDALLSGNFKESTEDCVKLGQANQDALQCLIQLMNYGFNKWEPKHLQLEISIILEMISLSDRFLLEELCSFITDCVRQYGICVKNLPEIYKWSIESKTNILRVESIVFALVGTIEESERILMFEEILNLGYTKDIASDVIPLIKRYLTFRM